MGYREIIGRKVLIRLLRGPFWAFIACELLGKVFTIEFGLWGSVQLRGLHAGG